MSTKVLNGHSHGSVETHVGANRVGTESYAPPPQSNRALPERAGSRPVPGTRLDQSSAAQRQIDALLKLNALLKEETALLAASLTTACRFAFHDELTNLPNRRLLQDHFDLAAAQGKRHHKQVLLLFLDLDGFKDINDVHGHSTGDRLLQQVASRLTACIRSSDTACRYGGDEFVVLLPDVESRDQAIAVTTKIRAQLALPYAIDGTPIRVTASIGMATYPIDGEDCRELIKAADMAMYRDKGRGVEPASKHIEKNPLSTC